MGHFYAGPCAFVANLAEWLFGCSHQKTTFPRSQRAGADTDLRNAPAETYVVCLECGRHVPYNWTKMRVRSPWKWPSSGDRNGTHPQ
jgi:hypothetical protein